MEFVFYSRITQFTYPVFSRSILENRYIEHWKTLLFNDDNKSGGNKLRTYRKLKTQFDLENYLCADVNKKMTDDLSAAIESGYNPSYSQYSNVCC
jgi:hypothetical protein